MDENRVVLEWVEGEDYINASLVNGYSQTKQFVATQHPLPGTRGDFWRMVLEIDTSTIVTIGPLPREEVGKSFLEQKLVFCCLLMLL